MALVQIATRWLNLGAIGRIGRTIGGQSAIDSRRRPGKVHHVQWVFPYFLFSFILLLASHSNAATIFVSSSLGDDGAPGTSGAPLRTITKALELAGPGDTVLVKAGTYNERLTITKSGQPGRPIVIQGERGSTGEWRSVLDTTESFSYSWVSAPEKGSPMIYKTNKIPYSPGALLVDGKAVWRAQDTYMSDGSAFAKFAKSPDAAIVTLYGKTKGLYWDGIDALFGYAAPYTYVRFRNGEDPNRKSIRVSAKKPAVHMNNVSYVVIRNLKIIGGYTGVKISGGTHNEVEGCHVLNPTDYRIRLDGTNTRIIDNFLEMKGYATIRPGGWVWRNVYTEGPLSAKEQIYREGEKGIIEDYRGVWLDGNENNEIGFNRIAYGLVGIRIGSRGPGQKIHNNTIYGHGAAGILNWSFGSTEVEIFNNLFYDNFYALRFMKLNNSSSPYKIYIYNNKFFSPWNNISYWHFGANPPADPVVYTYPQIFFYHNSMAGRSSWYLPDGPLPNTFFANNISSSMWTTFETGNTAIGVMDYNWFGGATSENSFMTKYAGSHNTYATGQFLWGDMTEGPADPSAWPVPSFDTPNNPDVKGKGIDLSKPFQIQGRSFQPLPGMTPGYFSGSAPDLGVVSGIGVIEPPPPPPADPCPDCNLTAAHVRDENASGGIVNACVWDGAASAEFSGDGPSGNQVTFSAMWSSGHLHVRVDVKDSSVEVDAAQIWMRDGVEIFISPQAHDDSTMRSGDKQLIVDAAGEVWAAGLQPTAHAVTEHSDGFTVELSLASEELGGAIGSEAALGFLVANNDRDGGITTFSDWTAAASNGGGYSQPNRWGTLHLAIEEVTCALVGCGDGVCDEAEDCARCAADCGQCQPSGTCDPASDSDCPVAVQGSGTCYRTADGKVHCDIEGVVPGCHSVGTRTCGWLVALAILAGWGRRRVGNRLRHAR